MRNRRQPGGAQDLAPKIDAYLQKRGSPMAGQGMAFLQAGRKYGIDPRMLVGIATIESGAGAHLAQPFNPFNWGIHRGQKYGSWGESINDVARGLRRYYLDQGLDTPDKIVSKYAPSSDGNDEGNWAKVVGQVMGQLGGAHVPAGATQMGATPNEAAPLLPQLPQANAAGMISGRPELDPVLLSRQIRDQFISGGGSINLMGLPQTLQSSMVTPQIPVPQQAAAASPAADLAPADEHEHGKTLTANGKVMNLPWEYKSTHATSGLEDEGFTRAVDIMAHPGTSVRSPGAGTVEYFHPTGAQGGGSMLIRFDNGRVGWLGHIANGVPGGTRVKAGDQLALISSDHAAPHAHWSIK